MRWGLSQDMPNIFCFHSTNEMIFSRFLNFFCGVLCVWPFSGIWSELVTIWTKCLAFYIKIKQVFLVISDFSSHQPCLFCLAFGWKPSLMAFIRKIFRTLILYFGKNPRNININKGCPKKLCHVRPVDTFITLIRLFMTKFSHLSFFLG